MTSYYVVLERNQASGVIESVADSDVFSDPTDAEATANDFAYSEAFRGGRAKFYVGRVEIVHEAADFSVFHESYKIEKDGHIGTVWSTDDRRSHATCSCNPKWAASGQGANTVLDMWRGHVLCIVQQNSRIIASSPGDER